jgi:hypothetical protein
MGEKPKSTVRMISCRVKMLLMLFDLRIYQIRNAIEQKQSHYCITGNIVIDFPSTIKIIFIVKWHWTLMNECLNINSFW